MRDSVAEGESKAFYEESEGEKRANKAAIIGLRAEIKLLHIKIQEAKQVRSSYSTSPCGWLMCIADLHD